MDVVVATFRAASEATAAAAALVSALDLDEDLVEVEVVRQSRAHREEEAGERGPDQAVLVAWVPGEERGLARDVISRHRGRHVPLDWLNARREDVDPKTLPDEAPRIRLWLGS
jgi:hypothetical protein